MIEEESWGGIDLSYAIAMSKQWLMGVIDEKIAAT
jgi:hypothetical protein